MGVNTRISLDSNYQAYLQRAIADGGTYEPVPTVQFINDYNKLIAYNPSTLFFPTTKKTGFLYALTPNTASGNFTCSRSSNSGSYFDRNGILQFASANEPRLPYVPLTKQFQGVLIEPSSTNRILQSTTYNSPWFFSGIQQVTDDLFLANSGKNLKVLVNDSITSNANSMCIRQSNIFIPQGVSTLSFFVKKTTSHSSVGVWGYDILGAYNVNYDVDTLTVTRPQTQARYTNRTGSITPLGNDLFYCTETFTSNTGSSFPLGFSPTTSGTNTMVAGQEISISCIQLEGSGSTSYIPTTSVTASRTGDIIQSPLLNFATSTWAIFFEIEYLGNFIQQSADISGNPLWWYFRRQSASTVNFWNQADQQNLGSYSFSPANSQKRFKCILSFNGSTINSFINGTKTGNAITPTSLSTFQTLFSAGTNRVRSTKADLGLGVDGPHAVKWIATYNYQLDDQSSIFLTTI